MFSCINFGSPAKIVRVPHVFGKMRHTKPKTEGEPSLSHTEVMHDVTLLSTQPHLILQHMYNIQHTFSHLVKNNPTMYLHPIPTKYQSHSQVEEPLQTIEDVKRIISSPEGRPILVSSGFQDIQISNRILPPHVSSDSEDAKYKDTFSWWNQKKLGEYATALYELKTQRGEEFRDRFLRYVTRKGNARRPDSQKLEMREFIDMLESADFFERNRASSIINGRLWMGKFDSVPQFCLQLALRGSYWLRLNGRAVHPPEVDTATCESYGVTSVFPNLYAGVRYKTASSDTSFRTLCFVTLGELDILDEA